MRHSLTRRALLVTALSSVASVAFAQAPLLSERPEPRPGSVKVDLAATLDSARDIVSEGRLNGTTGYVVVDLATGDLLEAGDADIGLPPASVTKAVTALYGLDALGAEHQFATRVIATGPIENGVLNGNLVLVGGGDPNLQTDQLATLVDATVAAGVTKVAGGFHIWDKAAPYVEEIDPPQLDHLGYNPSLSGLNLNFNRVHFEWKRVNGRYSISVDARSATYKPAVYTSRVRIVDRSTPVFTYAQDGTIDEWTVARGALGGDGSRWLPVRNPALYTADVFQTMARARGLPLPTPQKIDTEPEGTEIARFDGASLPEVLRDMLKFSTNITAEGVGLAASRAVGGEALALAVSGARMSQWAREHANVLASFVDHSGLGDQSRISAQDMTALLQEDGAEGQLWPILKEIVMTDENGKAIRDFPAEVRAKTGTLNFVSALSGYVRTPGGANLAFTIFSADLAAREAAKASGAESPDGAQYWNGRAKRVQQRLIQRWAQLYQTPVTETAQISE